MNPLLLSDEEFVSFLSNQIDYFLEINDTPDTSKGNLWEDMKAYLRGQTISYTASMNRRRTQCLDELTSLISEIDQNMQLNNQLTYTRKEEQRNSTQNLYLIITNLGSVHTDYFSTS